MTEVELKLYMEYLESECASLALATYTDGIYTDEERYTFAKILFSMADKTKMHPDVWLFSNKS